MRRIAFMFALATLQFGCVPTQSEVPVGLVTASGVLESLTGAIPGLSYDQAAVAAGSLLRLARARMAPGMFEDIAEGVAGSEALMDRATNAGLSDDLTGPESLTRVISEAEIDRAQWEQLTPAFAALVAERTDRETANAFSNAVR